MEQLSLFISKMKREGLSSVVVDTFVHYYKMVNSGETGLLSDKEIDPVGSKEIKDSEILKDYASAGKKVLKNAVRIVLNGGLGTSMGLTGAKFEPVAIPVLSDLPLVGAVFNQDILTYLVYLLLPLAWFFLFLPCLALPPAESPSTRKISLCFGSFT